MKKLQILIPQYHEDESILKPMLDSIAVQQSVDMNDIGVIIVNDGSDVLLSDAFLKSYPFEILYDQEEHRGVSAARNACLDRATAEYVMFCDADDMFFNACGLYIVMREMKEPGFDALVSVFVEESRHPQTKEPVYINHAMDSTFVHGKIYRRQFLLDENIRWNDALTIHEDSYFNCLCQKIAPEVKYCPTPFYLWKWRDASVCRHDPQYILKTYNNMLDSSTALIEEFLKRGRTKDAQFYATAMIYDAYFTMNKAEWINQKNKLYRSAVESRFKRYYTQFAGLFGTIEESIKNQIIMSMKNRMFGEGLFMESVTFEDWIRNVMESN